MVFMFRNFFFNNKKKLKKTTHSNETNLSILSFESKHMYKKVLRIMGL
jgi:hypothetical protein